jgi:hypothetical protein
MFHSKDCGSNTPPDQFHASDLSLPVRKRKYRERLDRPEPIGKVVERAGENRFAKKALPVPIDIWRHAVGPRIAAAAEPVSLDQGVLVVRTSTSVWANELSMLSDPIRAKLEQAGFPIKRLRFVVGSLFTKAAAPVPTIKRWVPPPARLPPSMQELLPSIEDPELAALLADAASKNLAWQSAREEPKPANEAERASRALRAAARENAQPGPTTRAAPAETRDTRENGPNRRR